MSRQQIVAYLAANRPTGDFEAEVGEIRQQVAEAKRSEVGSINNGEKEPVMEEQTSKAAGTSQHASPGRFYSRRTPNKTAPVSWAPEHYTPSMSQGPAKAEASNRLKWALELAKEKDEQRQRLGKFEGVKLVLWADGEIQDPPDPEVDECHLDLVYETQKDDESIASVAAKLGLAERLLLHLNKPLNKGLTNKSKLRRHHILKIDRG